MTTATRILALLQGREMTTTQMAEELGLSPNTVRITAARMRDSLPKRIYIAAWTARRPAQPCPIYAIGDQEDKAKPRRLSNKEKARRAWKRLKADPSKYTDSLMKQRIRHARQIPPPPPDPMMAWIPRRAA